MQREIYFVLNMYPEEGMYIFDHIEKKIKKIKDLANKFEDSLIIERE